MITLTTLALLLNVRVIVIIGIITAVGVLLYLLYFTAFFTRSEARIREELLKQKQAEQKEQAKATQPEEEINTTNNTNQTTKTTNEDGTNNIE